MRSKLLTQFLIRAGSLALAIAQGVVLLFILLIMYWLHGEPRAKLSQALGRDERTGQMGWVR